MITEVSYETLQKKKTLVVDAILSPTPHACRNCGSIVVDGNGRAVVVKNGEKEAIVRFEQCNHMPLAMHPKKQRYICESCRTHWMAQSCFVQPRHSIANHARYKIAFLLAEKVSLSFIVKNCQISLTAIIRILKEFKSYLSKQSKKILPRILVIDEFCSHASIGDKTSFICADGETGELVDVLPTRKLPRLTSYFLGCTNPEEIELLVIDMNAACLQFIKRILPNVKVVINRFRIARHMSQALNELCIRETSELRKAGQESRAEKLKKNWRFLPRSRANINHYEYETWKNSQTPEYSFPTEVMMINRLPEFSPPPKEAYLFFHELVKALQDKDPDLFLLLLVELSETLDDSFQEKFQNLLAYEEGITSAIIHPYSSGKIEAKNIHIKTMK